MRQTAIAAAAAALLALALTGCASAPAAKDRAADTEPTVLRVSAATTLKRAFEELAAGFEKTHPGVTIAGNYGASGVLQKQIERGAPVDVFASASPRQVDALVADGLVNPEATATLCGNDIAIIVPAADPLGIKSPEDLLRATRLATGDPNTASHGTVSRKWLSNLGLWGVLQRKFVFGENAAQTLDYVARGEVDAALVFSSEATGVKAVRVVYVAPTSELGTPPRYVIAPVGSTLQGKLAAEFINYLRTPESQQVLARWGFKPLEKMK